MSCNCIKELKERIKTELPKKNPQYADLVIDNVSFENECIIFGDKISEAGLNLEAILQHQKIGRKTSTKIRILTDFCPFCGKPYKEKVEGQIR